MLWIRQLHKSMDNLPGIVVISSTDCIEHISIVYLGVDIDTGCLVTIHC